VSIQGVFASGVDLAYELFYEYLVSVEYIRLGNSGTYDVSTDSISGADPSYTISGFWLGEKYAEVDPVISATASYIAGKTDDEGLKFLVRGAELTFIPKIGDLIKKDGLTWRVKIWKPLPGKPLYVFNLVEQK